MIKLLRPHQWYKNLLVFLALIFSNNLFNSNLIIKTTLGFIILCLLSSSNYIFNDLIDYHKDKKNPEKSTRPIASGKISIPIAIIIFISLLIISLISGFYLNIEFYYLLIAMFVITTTYTIILKNIPFADIITISSLFIIRAISGTAIINVRISPWLILGVLFFALFLVSGKRYGEILLLNENSISHRHVLKYYNKELLKEILTIFVGIFIIMFSLFSILSTHQNLIWTLPLFLFIILRYYSLILSNNIISRHPEKFIKDKQLLISSIIFTLLSLFILYL